jgi:predicted phosphodiesterase
MILSHTTGRKSIHQLKRFAMKKNLFLFIVLAFFISVSCEKIDQPQVTENLAIKLNDQVSSGHLKIAVVSDVHYLHSSLLINDAQNGIAFQKDLAKNPNKALMGYSAQIFKSVFVDLMDAKPDILLMPGDMTKDGELVSHEQMASYLKMLKDNGTKVFVVPGNNDIRNKDAVGYNGNISYAVPNISPGQFRLIYNDFGYGNAISKDDSSLSYVAEPVPGVWILGIDACVYNPVGSRMGKISSKTEGWINQQLGKAKEKKIFVIGLMHHNLIEHMTNQDSIIGPTVLYNSKAITKGFMSSGLEVIFTGHSHANDITQHIQGTSSIYDITTGSTITYPSQYRVLTLKNKEMEIETRYVKDIGEPMPGGLGFTDYAAKMQTDLLNKFFTGYLTMAPYKLSDSMAKASAPMAANAYMAFFAGDEKISPAEQAKVEALETFYPRPTFFINAVNSFWTDLSIKDNKWHLKLMEK